MTPTILSFPILSANPSTLSWKLQRFDARFTSPLSGTFQDILRPGAQWQYDMTWHVLSYPDSQLLAAWSDQMSQGGTRTALPNYAYVLQGSGAGTPVINGASQTGSSLTTSGWTASAANVLMAGDLIQVTSATQHQLLRVTANVSANSSGDATVDFTPALRFSPTTAGAIILSNPTVYFAFAKAGSSISYTAPHIAALSLSLVEDITQ